MSQYKNDREIFFQTFERFFCFVCHFEFENIFFIYRVFQQINQIRNYFEKFIDKLSIKIDEIYECLHITM